MAIHRNPEPLHYPKNAAVTDVLFQYNLNNTPPNKPAIIDGLSGEVVFTYAGFRDSVRKVARYLTTEVGIAPGAVVGILSTNRVGTRLRVETWWYAERFRKQLLIIHHCRTTIQHVCTLFLQSVLLCLR